uniref:DNA-directed RNA polymerase subunit n=2 Tax=Paramecium tetraurelia TaxID=5888 RepID=Q3SE62_PARTE|nr:DNA-directed RNA polymerase III largest subunit [Paramecium tetraurelia]
MYIKLNDIKRKIGGLQYSILSPQDAINLAEVKIFRDKNYDKMTGKNIEHGPLDLRMGQSLRDTQCSSCTLLNECPGHFGYIPLQLPIYHLGFFTHVVKCLKCLCYKCGQVRLTPDEINQLTQKMVHCIQTRSYNAQLKVFKKVLKKCRSNKQCPHCYCEQIGEAKKLAKGDAGKIILDTMDINALYAWNQFSNIPKQHQFLFCINPFLNDLSDLLTSIIPAPPNNIRPSKMLSNTTKADEDDLTMKLKTILYHNDLLQKQIKEGKDGMSILKTQFLTQAHYFHYFNSETPRLPQFSSKDGKVDIRGIYQRLKGKRGRLRGNLSGKRAEFTARSVISPDPNLAIDQVTIPQHIACILTVPETVTALNIKKMRDYVQNGPSIYPGAKFVKLGGVNYNLQFARRAHLAYKLKIGDVVDRHLLSEDIVIFNRQPSLHRISMMAFRARVDKWHTLRFNECVCTPFNADFDGDEMNIHLPQTYEARSEALILMDVKKNLKTIKSGESLVCLLQDFLTTAWLITNKDVFYSREQFMQFCAAFSDSNEQIDLPAPTILKPKQLWTGKQVINALLVPNRKTRLVLNLEAKESNAFKGKLDYLWMDPGDGYVVFDKCELVCGNIGKKVLGASKLGLFYALIRDNSTQIAASVMQRFAKLSSRWISHYGMTIGIGDVMAPKSLIEQIHQSTEQSYLQCKHYQRSLIDADPGLTVEQTLEAKVNKTLSDVREQVGSKCQEQLKSDNKVLIMYLCGAKGSNVNVAQMIGCVGQQVISGKRVPEGFTGRTLPHFKDCGDRYPNLDILHPKAKGFVKNSFYTGMDAIEFYFHNMAGREGLTDTAVKTATTGYMQRRLVKMLEDLHIAYDLTVRSCDTKEIVQFRYGEDGLDPLAVEDANEVIKLQNLLTNSFTVLRKNQILLNKEHMLIKLDELFMIIEERHKKFLENYEATYEKEKKRVQALFKSTNQQVSEKQLQWFIRSWMERFLTMVMAPGTSVGPITSQSIGEPATQMTLKTFHSAGVAGMSITQGVPRLNEIINASKEIKTPQINVKLINRQVMDHAKQFAKSGDPQYEYAHRAVIHSAQQAQDVNIQIEQTKLMQILKKMDEIYTADNCYIELELDCHCLARLKLEFVTPKYVCALILKELKLSPDDVKYDLKIIRITVKKSSKKKQSENLLFLIKELQRKLLRLHIYGCANIKQTVIQVTDKDDKENVKGEARLFASGIGFKEILRLDNIDWKRTVSNHIMEIQSALGIEAARQSIVNEVYTTMQSHSISIDIRHILLLAELMTFKGRILGFTRQGIDQLKNSALMLASFEKTMDVFFNAAIQGKQDSMNGASQRVIIGQNVPQGTGMFDLMFPVKENTILESTINQQKFLFASK